MFDLQVEQHLHDEVYHREIARLSMHQRLNHMALHFAKYAGKIAVATDAAAVRAACVDAFIIALSTANILNVELWALIERDGREFSGLEAYGRWISEKRNLGTERHDYPLREMVVAAGRMAAACEKIDHLEEVPFRAEIGASIAQTSVLAIGFISSQGIDPAQAVRNRLSTVKTRLKLHGRI